jgi:hypothetical protein
LAIEIDVTSLTQPADYVDIKVPELWIYRNQNGNSYDTSLVSQIFPTMPVVQLVPQYVEMAWSQGDSIAIRAFETAITEL